jgi:hypothetical protein
LDEALKKPATDVRQADIFSKIVNNDDSAKKLPDIGVRIVNNVSYNTIHYNHFLKIAA